MSVRRGQTVYLPDWCLENLRQVCIILESFPNLRQGLIRFVAILWLFYGYVFLRSREYKKHYFLLPLIKGEILTNGKVL